MQRPACPGVPEILPVQEFYGCRIASILIRCVIAQLSGGALSHAAKMG